LTEDVERKEWLRYQGKKKKRKKKRKKKKRNKRKSQAYISRSAFTLKVDGTPWTSYLRASDCHPHWQTPE